MFFSKKKSVGLDIGSNTIKLVEIIHKRKSKEVNSVLVLPTPKGAVVNGEVQDLSLIHI